MEQLDGFLCIVREDVIHHLRDGKISCQSHSGIDGLHRDVIGTGTLVQKRKSITHATVRQLCDKLRGVRIQFKRLLRCNVIQPVPDLGHTDALEGVSLTAGEDRGRDLIQFRGCQYEHQMFRWLLQDLQQRIESTDGEHVDLIHDINAFADGSGREDGIFPQGTDIVHAVVGSRIHLHDIHGGLFLDSPAGRTLSTGISVYRVFAVNCFGKDLGTGCLSGSPSADKQICMTQPVVHDLLFQGFRNMFLTYDIIKCLGSPFPV